MAKQKGPNSVPNKHIYTRASYLYQAASYLASQRRQAPEHGAPDQATNLRTEDGSQNLSRQLLTDMRTVTQKVMIRQSPDLKRTICKFCDTLQIEGQTSFSTIENASRGERKPWADVLAIRCNTCGHVKRFPISGPRQKRRASRLKEAKEVSKSDEAIKDDVT